MRQDSYLAFPTQHAQVNIHGADGQIFQNSGVVMLAIRFFPRSKPVPVAFHILPDFALPADALLGFSMFRSLRVDIYPKDGYLTFRKHKCLAMPNPCSLLRRLSHPSSRPDSNSSLASQPFTVHSDSQVFPSSLARLTALLAFIPHLPLLRVYVQR